MPLTYYPNGTPTKQERMYYAIENRLGYALLSECPAGYRKD